MVQHRMAGPDLVRAGKIPQPRRDIDGVAKTVAVQNFDRTTGNANSDRHAYGLMGLIEALLIEALHFDHGIDGLWPIWEHGQHAVTQHLHYASAVRHTKRAYPLGCLGDGLRRLFVSRGFENACTARKISKYNRGLNCCLNTHSLFVSLFFKSVMV